MKYTKLITAVTLGLSLSLSSCNFLDTVPQDFVAPENFFKNKEEAFMSLTTVYNRLMRQEVYGNTYPLMVAGTDDLGYYDRNTVPIGIFNNNISSSDNDVLKMWQNLYEAINNANFFLEQVDRVADMDGDTRTVYKGEAKFLRAYCYFLLAQCWGDVPYSTSSQKSVLEVEIANSPQKTVLENVVREMEEAEGMVGEIDQVPAGRISKSAVRGILARVYLKLAGWPLNGGKPMYEKAAYWAKQVNKEHKHQLNPEYSAVFTYLAADMVDTKYRESIWEAEYKGNRQDAHSGSGRLGNTIGIANGDASLESDGYSYGFISCTLNLWDMYNDLDGDGFVDAGFEEGSEKEVNHPDVRRNWNIAPFRYVKNSQNKFVKGDWGYKGHAKVDNDGKPSGTFTATQYVERNAGKYRREYEKVLPRDKNQTPINFPILRYADVLLMIAEADNEVNNGPTTEAYEAINLVRKRSIQGIADVQNMSYEAFKRLVKDERGRELCFEGLRKFDLIRWDDYLRNMKQVAINTEDSRWGAGKKFAVNYANNASERYKWLPIPNRELGLNGLLQQNKAWK
ncbi:MAG: RagB/SusD family nutrient uptake outer membrane protein [Bacteroidia bacterium]|nr:RagB/SusD family nutrient uptake outer membrane protein [Bacteroidia bacterium]